MPPNTPDIVGALVKWGVDLMWVTIAMVGGIARYLDGYVRTGAPPKFGLLVSHALVSGFSGYMVAQAVIKFSPDWALVAAGVGGYMGTQGLDWLANLLKVKFGGVDSLNNGDKR